MGYLTVPMSVHTLFAGTFQFHFGHNPAYFCNNSALFYFVLKTFLVSLLNQLSGEIKDQLGRLMMKSSKAQGTAYSWANTFAIPFRVSFTMTTTTSLFSQGNTFASRKEQHLRQSHSVTPRLSYPRSPINFCLNHPTVPLIGKNSELGTLKNINIFGKNYNHHRLPNGASVNFDHLMFFASFSSQQF